jgi:hypothetical protein
MSRAREVSKIVETVDLVENSIDNIDLSSTIITASAAAVSYLVDGAPEALNTLNELSAALSDDADFATTVTNELANKLSIVSASATYLTTSSASSSYVQKTGANYSVSNATAITVNTTTPTTIASINITTNGRPVLLFGTGDANPAVAGNWHYIALYRDSTQVGKLIINQTSGASYNNPWAVSHIDTPSSGTYNYTIKAYTGSGSMTYGEIGNVQAPTLVAIELF